MSLFVAQSVSLCRIRFHFTRTYNATSIFRNGISIARHGDFSQQIMLVWYFTQIHLTPNIVYDNLMYQK